MLPAIFSPRTGLLRLRTRRSGLIVCLAALLTLATGPLVPSPGVAATATPAPAITATPAPPLPQVNVSAPPVPAPVATPQAAPAIALTENAGSVLPPASVPVEAGRAISWDQLLDPVGKLSLDEVLFPTQQGLFTPYTPWAMPPQNGTLWLRASLAAQPGLETGWLLDVNTLFTGQAPELPQVWLVPPDSALGKALDPVYPGLYALPPAAAGTLYLRSPGVPSPLFMPQLRAEASLNALDTRLPDMVLLFFGSLFLLILLRGLLERREWRLWAALYAGGVLAYTFWGLPATPRGTVHLWDLPGLLAPGVALLMLPHVGRHILRTRQHAPLLDMQLILLGMPGLALTLAPLVPGYGWTLRYLPLWPLFMLLLVPTMVGALFKNLPGSRRFLLMCLLPPAALLLGYGLAPLGFIQSSGWLVAGLGYLPCLGLGLSVLCMAFSPTPAWLPEPDATKKSPFDAKKGQDRSGKAAQSARESALTLGSLPSLQADPNHGLPDVQIAGDSPAQSAGTTGAPGDKALLALEGDLREVLDTVFVNIAALDQIVLPQEARDISTALARSGRKFAGLIQHLPRRFKSEGEAVPKAASHRFDLRELMLQAHNAVATKAEAKNLALSWFSAPHLHRYFEGDGLMLYKVLTLLGESAVSATQTRGMVQIRAQRLSESNDPGQLVFTIIDTGSGMPPFGRSGMALVRAWELVGACGGSLRMDSTPTGTVVTCTLRFKAVSTSLPVNTPAVNEADNAEAARTTPKEAEPPILRIIVGSDVPANRQLMAYYLDELPHEVLEARSSGEAASLYSRTPGALLVLDGDLPEDDMANAIAAIRSFEGEQNYPPTSIVVLVNDDHQASRLRRAGCTHTLFKPILRTELRHLVLRLSPLPRPRKPAKTAAQPAQAQRQPRTGKPATRGGTLQNLPDLSLSPKAEHHTAEPVPEKKRWALLPSFSRQQDETREADHKHEFADLPLSSKAPASSSAVVGSAASPTPVASAAPSVPRPLSNVGEPMPIPRTAKDKTPKAADKETEKRRTTPAAILQSERRSDTSASGEWVGEPMPVVKPSVAASSDAPAPVRAAASAPHDVTEWVGEPMPVIKKTAAAEAAPVETPEPVHAHSSFASADAVEWVGDPTPVVKTAAQTSVAPTAPLSAPSRAPHDVAEWVGEPVPMTSKKTEDVSATPPAGLADESPIQAVDPVWVPLDSVEWVGEPMPMPKKSAPLPPEDELLVQPEPTEQADEAPLLGGFYLAFEPEEAFDKPLPEPAVALPTPTQPEPAPVTQPLSLLSMDDMPLAESAPAPRREQGRTSRGPKRLHLPGTGLDLMPDREDDAEEAPVITLFERIDDEADVPPATPATDQALPLPTFVLDTVPEVDEPALEAEEPPFVQDAPVEPETGPGDEQDAPEADLPAETLHEPQDEPHDNQPDAPDTEAAPTGTGAVAGDMARLMAAFDDVETGIRANNAGAVLAAAGALAMLAEELRLHMLAGQARCMEDLADGGDADAMREFLPELHDTVVRLKEELDEGLV